MRTPVSPPQNAFHFSRTVSFSDTDAAGVAHFTALMKYVEDAEHEALRRTGFTVHGSGEGWPRVHVDCDFLAPLRFGDKTEIILWLEAVGESSLTWNFHVHDNHTGVTVAVGQMVTVRRSDTGGKIEFSAEEKAGLSCLLGK